MMKLKKQNKKRNIRRKKSARKIQRWYRKTEEEKTKYTASIIIIYIFYYEDEEEMNKKIVELKRKKIKFFFRNIYDYLPGDKYQIVKVMYTQLFRLTQVNIKLTQRDYEKYNKHYMFRQDAIKDKYQQLLLTKKGKLTNPQHKLIFNNTYEEFDHIISICRRNEDFNDSYKRCGSYIDAIYVYAEPEEKTTEKYDPLSTDLYQEIDNNAICFKHIDYTMNENAHTFKDIFEFEQANKYISSNLKGKFMFF